VSDDSDDRDDGAHAPEPPEREPGSAPRGEDSPADGSPLEGSPVDEAPIDAPRSAEPLLEVEPAPPSPTSFEVVAPTEPLRSLPAWTTPGEELAPGPGDAPATLADGAQAASEPPPAPAFVEQPGPAALFRAGVAHALRCWRPLLAVVLVQLLLALTVVLPFHAAVSARLAKHPHAAALAGAPTDVDRALGWEAGMDAGLWRDTKRELEHTFQALPVVLAWTLLVAWLFGAVAAGGFLGLRAERGPFSTSRFLALGGKGFFRMLRVGIVFGLAFLVVGRIVVEGWGAAVADGEAQAATGESAWWGQRTRDAVLVVAFLVLRVVADLARADLIAGGRRSALLAFFRRVGTVVKRPFRTLGVAALLGVPTLLLLGALSLVVGGLPQGGWRGALALFAVLQAAVFVRWASRCALLGAFATRILPPQR
jgi:hypothetical protein